jgi:hypothetical protein
MCNYNRDYYDYQTEKDEKFQCDQESLEGKDFCLFHNENYLKDHLHPENKENVIEKLRERIKNSERNKMPLKCIGYYLPDIVLNKEFNQKVYFNYGKFQRAKFSSSKFSSEADFSDAISASRAYFYRTIFKEETNFSLSKFADICHFSGEFKDITYFNYVTFENPNRIMFEIKDMSGTSFLNTDFVGVKFSINIKWGGKDNSNH